MQRVRQWVAPSLAGSQRQQWEADKLSVCEGIYKSLQYPLYVLMIYDFGGFNDLA